MMRACVKDPPIFSRCILFQETACRQDINNLVGVFEVIYEKNMHANFQASSFSGMAGK